MNHVPTAGSTVSEDTFDRGAALLAKLSPEGVPPPWVTFADVAPVLGRSVGTAFGSIISRPALDIRTRELTTVGVLATLGGCEPQVAFHVGAALRAGATAHEVVEVITQVSVYAGVPRALNAVAAARDVIAAAGEDVRTDAPRAVVVRFFDALVGGDPAAARDLLADDVIVRLPGTERPRPAAGAPTAGQRVEELLGVLAAVRTGEVEIDEPLPARDAIYVPLTFRPSGPGRSQSAVLMMRVARGRVTEVVIHADAADLPPSMLSVRDNTRSEVVA